MDETEAEPAPLDWRREALAVGAWGLLPAWGLLIVASSVVERRAWDPQTGVRTAWATFVERHMLVRVEVAAGLTAAALTFGLVAVIRALARRRERARGLT